MREDGARTVLVSRDTLLAEVGGLPTGEPGGVLRMSNPTLNGGPQIDGSYVFASADGSQAYFQSVDQLTAGAPEGPPGNTAAKTYDFDVDTGVLTYLPGVVGQIVATDTDGSSIAFVRPAAAGEPEELDLWSASLGGGSVTPVVQLPGVGVSLRRGCRAMGRCWCSRLPAACRARSTVVALSRCTGMTCRGTCWGVCRVPSRGYGER